MTWRLRIAAASSHRLYDDCVNTSLRVGIVTVSDRASSGEDPIDRVDPGFKLKNELDKNKGKSDDHGHDH